MKKFKIISSVLYFLFLQTASAQNLINGFPETNGSVNKTILRGDSLFIGGSFTRVYNRDSSGSYGTLLHRTTGNVQAHWARPNNEVVTAISDGADGYYIGGSFTKVGDSIRIGVAHLNGQGQVTSQLSKTNVNGKVSALLIRNNNLYIGGSFSAIGEMVSSSSVIIDTNGTLLSSKYTTNGSVESSIPDGKGGWFIGGRFTQVGDSLRNGLAHLDSLGRVDGWNVGAGINSSTTVYSLALMGNTLYVGGAFADLGGLSRTQLGAVNASTGSVLPWNPSVVGYVYSIVATPTGVFVGGSNSLLTRLDPITGASTGWNPTLSSGAITTMFINGSTIYIGGTFNTVNSQIRNNLAALSTTSNTVTSWNPNANGWVYQMVPFGASLYLVGNFTSVGGISRNRIASVNLASGGFASTWNPAGADNLVRCMAIFGNKIYVGGDFSTIGGMPRKNIAQLDLTTGAVTTWSAIANNYVHSMAVSGSGLIVGGGFTHMGGYERNNLASYNILLDSITPWKPNTNNTVKALSYYNNNLFIGGEFTKVGSFDRNYIASVDTMGGVTSWNPSANNPVHCLHLLLNTLYVGGGFTNIGGQSRNRLAAYNLSSGTLTQWNPNADYDVRAIASRSNEVYIGGDFNNIGNVNQRFFCTVDTGSGGIINTFMPLIDGYIHSICVSGNTVYLGGKFNMVSSQIRNGFAAYDLVSRQLLSWSSYRHPLTTISAIALSSTGNVYVGGTAQNIGGSIRYRVALINLKTGELMPWRPTIDNDVNDLSLYGGALIYLGGKFTNVNGVVRNRLASINLSTGILTSWNPNANNDVYTMEISGLALYVGGNFTSIGGKSRNRVAAVPLFADSALAWDPNASSNVNSLCLFGDRVYLGGAFTSMGGQARFCLAEVNKTTGAVYNWNPTPSSWVSHLIIHGGSLYVGGNFTSIGGKNQKYSAAFNLNNDSIRNWDPNIDGPVYMLLAWQDKLYMGGSFSKYSYVYRKNLASVDTLLASPTAWKPPVDVLNDDVYALATNGINLYIGGIFQRSGNSLTRNCLAGVEVQALITVFSPNTTSFCAGDSLKISYSLSMPAKLGNTFKVQLSGPNGNWTDTTTLITKPGITSDSLMMKIPSTLKEGRGYRLRVISTNPAYTAVLNEAITIHALPKPAFSVNDTSQCFYQNRFVFTDTSSVQGGYSRLWNLGDSLGDTSTNIAPVKSFSFPGNYKATLFLKSAFGCKDSLVKPIIVFPPATLAFSANDSVQCHLGNSFLFMNTSISTTDSLTFNWEFGNGATDTAYSPVYVYPFPGIYKVKLSSISKGGCTDSISKQVIVNPSPVSSFTTDSAQCLSGNQFVMNNTSSGSPVLYHWNFGNSTTSVNTSPSVSYASAGNYSIRLVAQNSFGCNDTVVKNVRVKQNPAIPTFTYSPDTFVCDNINIVLKTGDTNTRSWMKDSSPLGVNADSLVVTNNPGSYSLKVTNTENCDATSTIANLFFKPTPVKPIVTVSGNVLTSSSTAGNQWYNNSGIISGETGQTYSASSIGQYYTIVTLNGCPSAASDVVNFPATGMASVSKNNSVSVYPNPNNGSFTIVPVQKIDGEVLVKLYDLTGRIVFEEVRNDNNLSIQTTGLANATYLLVVQTNDGLSRVKIAVFR